VFVVHVVLKKLNTKAQEIVDEVVKLQDNDKERVSEDRSGL